MDIIIYIIAEYFSARFFLASIAGSFFKVKEYETLEKSQRSTRKEFFGDTQQKAVT